MTDRERRSDDERRQQGGRSDPPDAWGIVPAYEDAFGAWTDVPRETRDVLVEAMGGDPSADGPPASDAVVVVQVGERVPLDGVGDGVVEVVLEDGSHIPFDDGVPSAELPTGYHTLVGEDGYERRLIVSPGRCRPPASDRMWGWATQLYAVRSAGNWGVGDLADLGELARWSASVGADTILINPLDAVTPVRPRETSPYYPSSRRFLDPIYLRVEDVPGVEVVDDLAELARVGRGFGERELIDRDAIAELKLDVLHRVWVQAPTAGNEPGFQRLLDERGESLLRFATFCVLAEEHGGGWRSWPDEFQHPDDEAVAALATQHTDRVRFHAWLQWLCDEQLAAACRYLDVLGDLPIAADPDGFDAWDWQDVIATGVSVGAPPDALAPQGQNWTLPAFVPWKLRAAAYEPFIEVVRAAMRHVGGLRIDHVLGLFRMFWVPPGGTAADGTYVRMPAKELLDILALESERAGTFVVGEDLGTVEEGVRDELAARDILRYQVWWFEQDPIQDWTSGALASVSTHDLPTVAGVWTGEDVDLVREVGLEPDLAWYETLRERLAALAGDDRATVKEVVAAVHEHVARAPNRIVVAQLDDALGVTDRINVPGTNRHERAANWSLPLPVPLEQLPDHPTVRATVDAMVRGRQRGATAEGD